MIQCQYNRMTPVTSQYAFSRESSAYGLNGRYRYNNDMRLYPDPWERMQAVLIEESTTNLLSASESLGFTSPITKTVTNETVYTVSITGTGSITLSNAGSGTVTASNPVTFTASSTSLTLTPSGDTGKVQLEAKSYATSWQIGDTDRSPETLTIPTAGVLNGSAFTIEMWIKQSIVTTSAFGHGKRLLDLGNGLWLWNYSPAWPDPQRDDDSNARRIIADFGKDADEVRQYLDLCSPTRFSTTDFEYFAVTFNGATFRFYRNDALWGSKAPSKINPFTQIVLGDAGWIIDDLRISSIARTDAEIAAAYQSEQPLPVDQYTTYKFYPRTARALIV